MLLACVLVDHFPVLVALQRQPELRGRPVVIVTASGTGRRVLDASPRATGVMVGMPLAEALGRCKDAVLVEPDTAHYEETWERVLHSIEGLGADVEPEALGLAFVRLDNVLTLLHGVEQALARLLGTVPAGLYPRLGVGPNKFTAWTAAQHAKRGASFGPVTDVRGFLAPQSVDILPQPWSMRQRLHGFALHTLGDVARLPAGAVQAQFGRQGFVAWELAKGTDRRPFLPRVHAATVEASLTFPAPAVLLPSILMGVEHLLRRAMAQPAMLHRYARTCTLSGTLQSGLAWTLALSFKEPVGDAEKAMRLVRHSLEARPPAGALEDLRLRLSELTGEAGRQESLWSEVRKEEHLKESLRQLNVRLGADAPIFRLRELEPWSTIPEQRHALVLYAS
ncbi:MAG: hypothetical protein FJ318_02520 [SAR202 cluster bacterium]|nr:hypothetical protein [SAR202 cluster bacterium]